MKQRITEKNLDKLSVEARIRLISWSKICKSFQDEILEGDYDPNTPLLLIGQMIEFLDERWEYLSISRWHVGNKKTGWGVTDTTHECRGGSTQLCSALWMAVRKELEK